MLSQVRPDDLDAIFDGALFGSPAPEASRAEAAPKPEGGAPVAVGAMEWFVERGARPAGPFRLERLRELWHRGELSPDTLCWCEAWSQWRPLSRVPELVTALTDAGLPTVAAGTSAPVAPARAREAGPEAKKGATVLPALVAEEEAWLRKVREEQEQAKEEARAALLEAPSAPVPVSVLPPHLVPEPVTQPEAPVAPAGLLEPVSPEVGVPAVPYPGLAGPMMPPAVPATTAGRGKWLVAGALLGTTAAGLLVGAWLLMPRHQGASERGPEAPPPPAAVAEKAPVPEEVPRQAEAPVAAQAVVPAPVVAAAPVEPPAPPAPPSPAPVAPESGKQEAKVITTSAQVEGRSASSPQAERAPVAPAPPRKVTVAEAAPVAREKDISGRRQAASRPEESTLADDPHDHGDAIDKEFERALSPDRRAVDPRSKRTVYLPPEPGQEVPESLSTSDIVRVVSAHKEGILSCLEEHEPPTPASGKGRFVVRWRIQPSGGTSEVLLETESLKGTPFARCIEAQVRSWKFPLHRVPGREPVRFPFTY